MAKKRRHHKRRRFYNPHRRHHYRRHRLNPSLSGGSFKTAAWVAGGAVGTRALTQLVLGTKNTGYMGYGGNLAVAYGLSWGVGKFAGAAAEDASWWGGLAALILRIVSEQFFASSPLKKELALQGMGDADFALKGYVTDPFFLPTSSQGPDLTTTFPSIAAYAPVPVPKGGMSGYYDGGEQIDRYVAPWGGVGR